MLQKINLILKSILKKGAFYIFLGIFSVINFKLKQVIKIGLFFA